MGKYIGISPTVACATLSGEWKEYVKVLLKAAVYIEEDKARIVLYGDGQRRDGSWSRVPLYNIILENDKELEDLASLIIGFLAFRKNMTYDELRQTMHKLIPKTMRVAFWLRRARKLGAGKDEGEVPDM